MSVIPRIFGRSDGAETIPLSEDDYHDIAANERRRAVIRDVADDGRTCLAHLAELQADREVEGHATKREVKRVYIALYQCHLPKLREAGLIIYDRNSGRVEASDITGDVAGLLDADAALLAGGEQR